MIFGLTSLWIYLVKALPHLMYLNMFIEIQNMPEFKQNIIKFKQNFIKWSYSWVLNSAGSVCIILVPLLQQCAEWSGLSLTSGGVLVVGWKRSAQKVPAYYQFVQHKSHKSWDWTLNSMVSLVVIGMAAHGCIFCYLLGLIWYWRSLFSGMFHHSVW